jgi:hypothetical protein
VSLYEHSLQTATRALRAGEDEETVVVALLHDIGELMSPSSHGDVANAMLLPYISEKNQWVLKMHEIFQGYYYFHHQEVCVRVCVRICDCVSIFMALLLLAPAKIYTFILLYRVGTVTSVTTTRTMSTMVPARTSASTTIKRALMRHTTVCLWKHSGKLTPKACKFTLTNTHNLHLDTQTLT